jgi:signal transduction histidine kinase
MSEEAIGLRFATSSPESALSKLFNLNYWHLFLSTLRHSLRKYKRSHGLGVQLLRMKPNEGGRAFDDDRKELSRDLHDSVGPLLTAVGLQLRAVRSTGLMPSALEEQLDEACRLNAEALRLIRDLAMGIRPAPLDDVNLVVGLECQARQFSRQTGIDVSLEAGADLAHLPINHCTCIYRCVSEALTNCGKHSHAKSVHVVVGIWDGHVNVRIDDDGIGFDGRHQEAGVGLLGMRERAAELNGNFSISSRQQGGTAVTLEIPVPDGVVV